VDYVVKANLRVTANEFEKTFDDPEGMTTGRYDTRFLGPTLDPLSEGAEYDPQSAAISSAYFSLVNLYLRQDLKYGAGETYLPRALFNGAPWDMTRAGGRGFRSALGLNVGDDLAEAMKTNPRLKVMVNDGYYDLATPFFAAEYEEEHLPIPASLTKNIEYDWYESGPHGLCARRMPQATPRPGGGVYQERGQPTIAEIKFGLDVANTPRPW
jgi:carboxypeptidase C (cathepsin A)